MKMKIALLAAAGSMALISGATAQEMQGYYGALGAGIAIESDSNDLQSADSSPAAFDTNLDLDSNISVYGAIGRYFANGWRGEIELATRTQEVKSLPGDGLGFAGFPSSTKLGDISATTLMVNAIKDFNIDAAGRLNPYLGAGVGAAFLRSEYNNITDGVFANNVADMATSNFIVMEDSEAVAAIQGLAGLTFDFTDDMMFTVGYRYLQTGEYKSPAYINGPAANLTGEYSVHEVMAGIRWNWGAPVAAAPVPAPVTMKTCFDGSRIPVGEQCPPQVAVSTVTEVDPLTIYFDYDKATLSNASEQLIDAKVAEVMEGDLTGVKVMGNTDTSGSKAYNQALSARRAGVVRDALVGRGIDANVITVEALGESNPAKPTGDGVKEPLNRRTDVEFSF